jgi:hypothetical protein
MNRRTPNKEYRITKFVAEHGEYRRIWPKEYHGQGKLAGIFTSAFCGSVFDILRFGMPHHIIEWSLAAYRFALRAIASHSAPQRLSAKTIPETAPF